MLSQVVQYVVPFFAAYGFSLDLLYFLLLLIRRSLAFVPSAYSAIVSLAGSEDAGYIGVNAEAMEISAVAKAGVGGLQHGGLKLDANFQLPDCRRRLQ